jgi:FMN phosphatase YigB (HAD superfamily)
MCHIKNILFDFGGVIMEIDYPQAVQAFLKLGLTDAVKQLDPYTQAGIFGDLESGKISDEDFRRQLSCMVGRELTWKECQTAWRGYCKDLPRRNLLALKKLRAEGYRVILLSNTNPFMMGWAMSDEFDGEGHPLSDYLDAAYLSYQCKIMKPKPEIFQLILKEENIQPEETLFVDDGPKNVAAAAQLGFKVFCPPDGSDWTNEIYQHL